ncbi:hypothetical protein ABEB36_004876 [Hypothenemus hampei]|uniref:Uncharacterized protein n=1 Tax=Hypothenemus hampei TaxID=57062 RepID=A0ABD1EWA4_HYPHA
MSTNGRTNTISTTTHLHSHNKRPIIIYPTVSPETVVIPIISCIFGFPLLALLVICCLRRRAKLAREQARRRTNMDFNHGTFSIVRFSSLHYLDRSRAISFRSERAMSRGFPSLELDTVVEERSEPEAEQTVVEIMTPDGDSSNKSIQER